MAMRTFLFDFWEHLIRRHWRHLFLKEKALKEKCGKPRFSAFAVSVCYGLIFNGIAIRVTKDKLALFADDGEGVKLRAVIKAQPDHCGEIRLLQQSIFSAADYARGLGGLYVAYAVKAQAAAVRSNELAHKEGCDV